MNASSHDLITDRTGAASKVNDLCCCGRAVVVVTLLTELTYLLRSWGAGCAGVFGVLGWVLGMRACVWLVSGSAVGCCRDDK
jgi:hypothetical protein